MRIDVLSIFPEYLEPLKLSLIGKAVTDGLLSLQVTDPRQFATDRHRTVDDTPYGGGAGMVMKPEPWAQALETVVRAGAGAGRAASSRPVLVVPSPAGEVFTQEVAYELAEEEHLVFACGRYEGIDERFIDWARDEVRVRPLSLGDYVLNGGEVAVLAMVEAVTRLIPGVIGNPESLAEESHTGGLLEYPVYTKPAQWRERTVPDTLLSGHHGWIARWRRDQQLVRTARRRPDMVLALDPATMDRADLAVLAEEGFTVAGGQWRRSDRTTPQGAPEDPSDMA
ncbi:MULTISPECIES: tRNA (guanosine(37)-N1)-methyltransferase TrmD [Kocuria]|uniref:tRNA (guanosine(37)-N1)-methyltransferase TrmD n=1 Tax=Kocuria TaxID=57493 RepID=UPI0008A40994|nr:MULTISPECIES: tRNA (guanosine(37)-N1)-methyltransferase TrmD [Kocuria]MCT1958171.1 tRNA (guanosine(37)-N1)-methyltransferase TrmD [Kocuria rhizophila]MCT2072612.1 tRNA (guanosine(37)-N1)-methyltransferase TrmD [Kocuria rhizophila]MDR7374466.1 tRNA (guanine37-N1)-methyltransferase [Kocuria rhizophila]OFK07186.1 tRNA (guanine(37)-N(1))-methyltransferase [Kocuria sp. HMSC066H03]PKZ38924.1 tRNA (guanosine(37)-N1)-methyltransferase TrmD [Kocuria rhizophila]